MDTLKLFGLTILGLLVLVGDHHVICTPTDLQVIKSNASSSSAQASVYCTYNSDCSFAYGIHTECYAGRCICDIGYYQYINGGQCTKIPCTFNSACTLKQYNTRCSFGTCVCDYGTYLDYSSQTCLYSNNGVKVGVPVGVVLFFIFIGIIIFAVIRRRRRVVRTRVVMAPGQQTVVQQARPTTGYQNPNYAQNPYYPTQAPPQQQVYQQQQYQQQQAPPPYNPGFQGAPQPNSAPYPTGGKY